MHRFIILSISSRCPPPLPELSIGCRDTRMAASLSADRGESDRDIFAVVRHVRGAYRMTVASKRVVRAAVGFRYGPRPVASSSSASSAYPTAVRERSVGRSVRPSVRPAGILTHVGSVLRQRGGGFSCPSRLLLLRHLILHPRDALPLSATELPREASSTAPTLPLPPFACSPLLTPPPSLHLLLFRPLLPPLHVATGTTTTVRDTTTAATASTTPPPPPSPGLPHLQSRPGGFPTT